MTYDELREITLTGDVAMVEGEAVFSWVIRKLLGQQFSHIALFFWRAEGLWVAEMVEGIGFRIVPASWWVTQQSGKIFWGKAPNVVRVNTLSVLRYIDHYRGDPNLQGYGYFTLLKVWASQRFGGKSSPREQVCSTFVQGAWEGTGWKNNETESPGGFLDHVRELRPVEVSK